MRKQKLLCATLIALNLALIWGNSCLPAEASDSVSGGLLDFLSFLPNSELVHKLLRKAAHFSEFALLGLLMGRMQTLCAGKPHPATLGLGLFVGCVDETIQVFVPGRSSSILDVWIDFSGFATGMAVLTFGYIYFKHKQDSLEDTKL